MTEDSADGAREHDSRDDAMNSGPISDDRTEADIFTRWDSPRAIPKLLPPNVELVDYYGVRVLTPFAAVRRIPWMARGLSPAERLAGRSLLRYFGGFLIAVLRKSSGVDTARR